MLGFFVYLVFILSQIAMTATSINVLGLTFVDRSCNKFVYLIRSSDSDSQLQKSSSQLHSQLGIPSHLYVAYAQYSPGFFTVGVGKEGMFDCFLYCSWRAT